MPTPTGPGGPGVSAFGFGGTNFHAVLEAYDRDPTPRPPRRLRDWPAELLVWRGGPAGRRCSRRSTAWSGSLDAGARPALRDLSHTLIAAGVDDAARTRAGADPGDRGRARTTTCATSCDRPRAAIAEGRAGPRRPARHLLRGAPGLGRTRRWRSCSRARGRSRRGCSASWPWCSPRSARRSRSSTAPCWPAGGTASGPLIFPPPAFDDAAREEARRALIADRRGPAGRRGRVRRDAPAARSPGTASPTWSAGHSYGELVALHAAGVLDARDLAELSSARGRLMLEAGHGAAGAMAAILAGPDESESLDPDGAGRPGRQLERPAADGRRRAGRGRRARSSRSAAARDIAARRLPVSSAFHTPMVAGAREPLARSPRRVASRQSPDRPVYSNLDAAPHPAEPSAIAARLGEHLASPVRFADMVEAMHRDGARVFVEVGPGSILTPMVDSILDDRPHLAVSCDAAPAPGLSGLLAAARAPGRRRAAAPPGAADRRPGRGAGSTSTICRPASSPSRPRPPPGSSTAAAPGPSPRPSRPGSGRGRLCPIPAPRITRPDSDLAARQRQRHTATESRSPPMTHKPPTAPAPRAAPAPPHADPRASAGRPGPRVVPEDDAGLPRGPEGDDARLPQRPSRRRAPR